MLQSYLMLCFVAMVTVFTYQSLNSKPILLDQAKEMLLNVVIYATVIVWTRFTLLFGAVSLLTTYHLYYVIALATLTFLVSLVAECLRLAALVQNQPILEWQSMFYITSAAIQLWTFSLVIIALGVLLFVSVCVFLYQKGATDTKPLLKQLVYLVFSCALAVGCVVCWTLYRLSSQTDRIYYDVQEAIVLLYPSLLTIQYKGMQTISLPKRKNKRSAALQSTELVDSRTALT